MISAKPSLSIWGMLIFLGIIWGGSFSAVSVALTGFGPVSIAAIRISLAASILLVLAYTLSDGLPSLKTATGRRIWLHCSGMALFTNALPFTLLSWGQLHVSSGFAGITMAVVPLMILPLAHFLIPGEVLTRKKLIGFVVGFAGVLILIGPKALLSSGAELESLARMACLSATACYAIGSVITRLCPPTPQLGFSAVALLIACVIMLPLAYLNEGIPSDVPVKAMVAIAYLGVIPTALATVLLVRIIKQAGPSFLSLVNYQVPVWAALMGVIFLSETLPAQFIGALALVLAGLAISQARGRQRFRP